MGETHNAPILECDMAKEAKAAKLLQKIANALGAAKDCGDDKRKQYVPDELMGKLMKWRTTKPEE